MKNFFKSMTCSTLLQIIIILIIVVFYFLTFYVKTKLVWLFITSIISLVVYLYICCKNLTGKEITLLFDFYGLDYDSSCNEQTKYLKKNINRFFEFIEKFATLSALITFTFAIVVINHNSLINLFISLVLNIVLTIMFFHYVIKFTIYLVIPSENCTNCTSTRVSFLSGINAVIVGVVIYTIISLGLEFIPKEQLFCHTDELKSYMKIIGSKFCLTK